MLCDLISYVDEKLSFTITFAIFNDLYYILIQLLNTFQWVKWFISIDLDLELFYNWLNVTNFRPKDTVIENVYFWLSLMFLIGRMTLISLSAARIHDESKKSLQVIHAIPADHYHIEVRMFSLAFSIYILIAFVPVW